MHHPWRRLRDLLPDWEVMLVPLPPGVLGGTDSRSRRIWIDSRQSQRARRCTLDHELHHAEGGDVGPQHPKRERAVDEMSARRLIPLDRLLDALAWAHGPEEAADELWVDLRTFTIRMKHLHASEIAAVRRVIANRDNEDET